MAYKDKSKAMEYNNKYNTENYDRVSLMLPKGMKEQIRALAGSNGESVNGYITTAIRERMEREEE